MDRKAPLVALLLFAFAVPASAEFCAFDGSRTEIVVRRIKGPMCTMDNALVFSKLTNENRYGADENKDTRLTDSWPGWGGGDQKCAAARKSAENIVYSDETYVLGKAVLLGPQVWKFNGSCDTFKSRFQSKKASLGEKPSHEDVFEAMGAERISMGDLAERLVEGKK
ncbi:MAG: hypothetical protein Q8T11_08825 [Elusimicrobiota bacterium]|nr:hypothetical protein [Elusimicrobiota bacterium]